MTQGQTERLIRDMREYAEEYRGSVLGDCLDALLQYVADLQGDNECLLQQRDAEHGRTVRPDIADRLLGLRGKLDCTLIAETEEEAK